MGNHHQRVGRGAIFSDGSNRGDIFNFIPAAQSTTGWSLRPQSTHSAPLLDGQLNRMQLCIPAGPADGVEIQDPKLIELRG
jgi:hypothetical protein